MAYSDVVWSLREPVTSAKLQQMADNERYLKDKVDIYPRGVLARAKLKTNQVSNTVWWDIPGLTCSASYEAQRTIKVSLTWQGLLVAGMPGIWAVRIQSGNAILAEQWINMTQDFTACGGGTVFTTGVSDVAGSKTWKASLYKVNADGTENGGIAWLASQQGPSELIVEDIGPSTVVQ